MADDEHVRVFRQGVQVWNQWREANPNVRPDLSEIFLAESEVRIGQDEHGNKTKSWQTTSDYLERVRDLSFMNLTDANLYRSFLIQANLWGVDCQGADLRESHLNHAVLSHAKLARANLEGSDLVHADLSFARLRESNLSGADLNGADLRCADLSEATLARTDLAWSHLGWTHLERTNLSEAEMRWTVLADVDLSQALGLETISHRGPSALDVRTLLKSGGNIPEQFLRGIGASEVLIKFANSLSRKPIEFYSCFISYSSEDYSCAQRLHTDLQMKGVRCWFAPEDMMIGDRIRSRIDESIRLHDKVLLVLSKSSLASAWVEQEVETALERERRHGKAVLFPIRLDDTVMEVEKGWPALIRNTRHIGDFRQWKDHDTYQVAFERLLGDLKAEGGG